MDLFSNTFILFLKSLDKDQLSRVPEAIQQWHTSKSEGRFGLGPAGSNVKLINLAQYLYEMIVIFEKDNESKNSEPYQMLDRLFANNVNAKTGPSQIKTHPKTIRSMLRKSLRR